MIIKSVERLSFTNRAQVVVDLNRMDSNGHPAVEVYHGSTWEYTQPLNMCIVYEDKQVNLVIRLAGGQNVVVNK